MMKQALQRGFTLIELLVVIAIIGILASVVLASLNDARDKGEDSQIKQQMSSMRAEAELSYDDNDRSYDEVCTDVANLRDVNQDGDSTDTGDVQCADAAGGWVAWADISTGEHWCVDSSGASKDIAGTVTPTAATLCP